MTLQIGREEVKDDMIYDIMYFSPVECGEERYQTMLYFQTEMYYKQWPVHKVWEREPLAGFRHTHHIMQSFS